MRLVLYIIIALFVTPSAWSQAGAGPPADIWGVKTLWCSPLEKAPNLWVFYRSDFLMSGSRSDAVLKIAADTKYWIWINGELILREGGLKRGPTPCGTYYDRIDIGGTVKQGLNKIVVLEWYMGRDGYNHKDSGRPGLIFEIISKRGTLAQSGARTQYRLYNGFSALQPGPNVRFPESSLSYDATIEAGDWLNPERDDGSRWKPVVCAGPAGCVPWGQMVLRPIPFFRFSPLESVALAASDAAHWTGKLPSNVQFDLWVHVDGLAGTTLDFRTDANMPGQSNRGLTQRYILKAGDQVFEFPEWLNGQQVYVQSTAPLKRLELKIRRREFGTPETGEFHCSDEFLNRLWQKARNTVAVNMDDNWCDCPNRERAAWMGDAVIATDQVGWLYGPGGALLTSKLFSEVSGWRRTDGTIFAPLPAGNWNQELPQQMLAAASEFGLWRWYQITADKAGLRRAYDTFHDYLHLWRFSTDGTVSHREGGWNWSDWGENADADLLEQMWYLLGLQGIRKCAVALGENVSGIDLEIARLSTAISYKFGRRNGCFASDAFKSRPDERANALAVIAGLVDAHNLPVRSLLAQSENCSPYFERYVLEALFRLGDKDVAMARLKKRYTAMVEDESSTLAETFPASGTKNHLWSTGVVSILTEHVVGLTPLEPGWRHFRLEPHLSGLQEARCRIPASGSRLDVSIEKKTNEIQIRVEVPKGCALDWVLPDTLDAMALRALYCEMDGRSVSCVSGGTLGPGSYLIRGLYSLKNSASRSFREP